MTRGTFGEWPLRPDLAVPLPPVDRGAALVRFGLTTLHEPDFGRAHRQTAWMVAVAMVLIAGGQFAVAGWLREPVTTTGVAVAAYAALRVVSLRRLERRQYAFEPGWLADRSAGLRAGQFEVVRCAVDRRMYDLTDPDTARELAGVDGGARVVLDLRLEPATLERVYRRLRDVTFHPALRPGTPARARFPDARYAVRPPGRETYWLLGALLVLTVAAPAGPVATHAGTGSRDPAGAAPRAGARPRGTSSA